MFCELSSPCYSYMSVITRLSVSSLSKQDS